MCNRPYPSATPPCFFPWKRARQTLARRSRNSWRAFFMRGPGPAGGPGQDRARRLGSRDKAAGIETDRPATERSDGANHGEGDRLGQRPHPYSSPNSCS
jgi:hypothetical protein